MDQLIAQCSRLYLLPDAAPHAAPGPVPVPLVSPEGLTRAVVIAFPRRRDAGPDQHWHDLCEVANRLQAAFGFPAPAVSITGSDGYLLWLSLAEPVPVGDARRFLALLRETQFSGLELQAPDAVALPPFQHPDSGKWAAFIHPGMGASFAEEAGLEMAPPGAGQLAFLEGLESIGRAAFNDALAAMKQPDAAPPAAAIATPVAAEGLLLKDATLEDIVRHLHALNIEPTFRHLLPRRD